MWTVGPLGWTITLLERIFEYRFYLMVYFLTYTSFRNKELRFWQQRREVNFWYSAHMLNFLIICMCMSACVYYLCRVCVCVHLWSAIAFHAYPESFSVIWWPAHCQHCLGNRICKRLALFSLLLCKLLEILTFSTNYNFRGANKISYAILSLRQKKRKTYCLSASKC